MKKIPMSNPDRLIRGFVDWALDACSPDEFRYRAKVPRCVIMQYVSAEAAHAELGAIRTRYSNLHLTGEGVLSDQNKYGFNYTDCEECSLSVGVREESIYVSVEFGHNRIAVHQQNRIERARNVVVGNLSQVYPLEQVSPNQYRSSVRFDLNEDRGITEFLYIPGATPYYQDFRIVDGQIIGNLTDDPNMSWKIGLGIILRMIIRIQQDSFEIEFEILKQ